MADPLEIYRQLRQSYRAFPMPQYDAWALPRFDDVWEVSRDRERFSIVEGPVSHRDRLLVRNDGPPDRRLGDAELIRLGGLHHLHRTGPIGPVRQRPHRAETVAVGDRQRAAASRASGLLGRRPVRGV